MDIEVKVNGGTIFLKDPPAKLRKMYARKALEIKVAANTPKADELGLQFFDWEEGIIEGYILNRPEALADMKLEDWPTTEHDAVVDTFRKLVTFQAPSIPEIEKK